MRIHATRGIPNDAVFFLEDFLLAPPDEMAGAEVLVFASRDFLMGLALAFFVATKEKGFFGWISDIGRSRMGADPLIGKIHRYDFVPVDNR